MSSPSNDALNKRAAMIREVLPSVFDHAELSPEVIDALKSRLFYLQIVSSNMKAEEMTPVNTWLGDSGWVVHDFGQAMSSSPGVLAYENHDFTLVGSEELRSKIEGSSLACTRCDYVYSEVQGWPDEGIDPGTTAQEVPEGWSCPYCSEIMQASSGSENEYAVMVTQEGEPLGRGHGTLVKQAFDTARSMVEAASFHGWEGVYIVEGHPTMQLSVWMACKEFNLIADGFEPDRQQVRQSRGIGFAS